jgi:NADH-quinone oxidoreductase subunit M
MHVSALTDWLIWLPIGTAIVLWTVPLSRYWTGGLAVLVSLVEVGLWIEQATRFDFSKSGVQFETKASWFSDLHVNYHVGFYGFSLWLAGLTVVVAAACVIYGFWVGRERARAYFGLMLFLTGSTVAVFAAQDLLLFYAAFEAMLIPLYLLVGAWGGPGRMHATMKFVIYTMAGSLFMLAAVIVFGLQQHTFDLVDSGTSSSNWIWLGFAAAFAVKSPLIGFHGWLPDTYGEAPPEVTALLSGVIAKAGTYGFLRIAIAKMPEPTQYFRTTMLAFGIATLLYGSVIAFRSRDFRSVVAYSSMAQSGLIVVGLFANTNLGFDGAVLQMLAHGFVSAALFLIAGTVERRTTTSEFRLLGGMAKGRPLLATLLMATGVITLAVPGSVNFAGEFLILAGVFQRAWWWAALGAAGIVLAAMYALRLISAVLHGARGSTVTEDALDLRAGEMAVIVPLVACLVALSVWPAGVSHHSFPGDQPQQTISRQFR